MSRTRTVDGTTPSYWLTDMYRPGPTPWTGTHYFSTPVSCWGTRSTMTDTLHPNWKTSSRLGVLVLGNMELVRWYREYAPGELMEGPFGGTSLLVGAAGSYNFIHGDITSSVEAAITHLNVSPLSTDLGTMTNVALAKAFAKVDSAVMVSGETLKDLGATVGMLRRPFKGAFDLLSRMTKARNRHLGKTAVSATKANAGAWLEYRYGWKPLILDCEGLMDEASKKREHVNKRRLVARAGERLSYNNTRPFVNQPLSEGSTFRVTGSHNLEHEVTASAGVIYGVKNRTTSEELSRIFGTRARDLPATLWEIIPYSFVIDWFVNVGPWLSAVTPNPDVNVEASWVTTVDRRTDNYSGGIITDTQNVPPVVALTGSWGAGTVRNTVVRRTINPPMSATPVWTGKPMSVLHSIDALSLSAGKILTALQGFRH